MRGDDHPDSAGEKCPDSDRPVAIPEHTARAVEARLDGTQFETVDEYVAVALELLLEQLESPEPPGDQEAETEADPVEDEAVRERLETLGYL